jgi:ribonuclease G
LLRFLRKKKKDEAEEEPAPAVAATPPAPIQDVAAQDGDTATTKPKRRRGSRGGRGRRKTADAQAAKTVEAESPAKPERKPAKAARKPAQTERKPAAKRSPSRRRIEPRRAALPAAKRELLVSVDVSEQRVAVLEDDRVAEVYLERPERRSIAGNVYLGIVDNVLPGMEAAFVEMGLEKNGFLYVDEIVVPELEGKRHGKRIQDLLSRGQTLLVQAVKDPMKSKGARLTTDISLPGRFVVFVPSGEGLGVSRRLPDEERARLRDIIKGLDVPSGGVIVRTAAEGASAEDVERDLVFLQRLWKTIQARAKTLEAPALVYQEAELPLRVVRDLFTEDFERALVDHDRTYKRIVGYLKKTSPHMVERVVRYKEKAPLFEASGVDAEIRSTLSRRVDLPSGGYLIFDYAEAFTVIDVNTGRFVGSRGKGSGGRLEDTITKNNLEAVKEVVRQLRLRDIGGIIVIDFIDMANPKNRVLVEEALKTELERDRTKTYVVEISPLGLVEMTRQNVTDGPREILTRKCPTCAGDGVVVSEYTAAVDVERRLRGLTAGSRTQAFRVELNARVASVLIGPAAERLVEIESQTRRRFFIVPAENVALDHFKVLAEGKLDELLPKAPVAEGDEIELKLVELGLHDPTSAVGKVDGYDVTVAGTAKLVGKKVKARVERLLDGGGYARWLGGPTAAAAPITAESEAEKPTRAPRARKAAAVEEAPEPEAEATAVAEAVEEQEVAVDVEPGEEAAEGAEKPKRKTRRGSRGGRGRKRKPAAGAAEAGAEGTEAAAEDPEAAAEETPEEPAEAAAAPRIHVPGEDLGREQPAEDEPPAADAEPTAEEETPPERSADDGEEPKPAKKKTRRGTRGGRNRKRKPEMVPAGAGAEQASGDATLPEAATEAAPEDGKDEWEYVPMSEWEDELSS